MKQLLESGPKNFLCFYFLGGFVLLFLALFFFPPETGSTSWPPTTKILLPQPPKCGITGACYHNLTQIGLSNGPVRAYYLKASSSPCPELWHRGLASMRITIYSGTGHNKTTSMTRKGRTSSLKHIHSMKKRGLSVRCFILLQGVQTHIGLDLPSSGHVEKEAGILDSSISNFNWKCLELSWWLLRRSL